MAQFTRHTFVFLALIFVMIKYSSADASVIKAPELLTMCQEIEKGKVGETFDGVAASKCQGYFAGFYDTVIILEQMSNRKFFCMPKSIPQGNNTQILESWIISNKEIAKKTTASVALLSAYQKAFPCPKHH